VGPFHLEVRSMRCLLVATAAVGCSCCALPAGPDCLISAPPQGRGWTGANQPQLWQLQVVTPTARRLRWFLTAWCVLRLVDVCCGWWHCHSNTCSMWICRGCSCQQHIVQPVPESPAKHHNDSPTTHNFAPAALSSAQHIVCKSMGLRHCCNM
jgi:hypothetical protein